MISPPKGVVIDIVNGSGVPKNDPTNFLGGKTDPRQHYEYRFSQDLPKKSIFRCRMAPTKKRVTASDKILMETSKELENTHMNTTLPPSIHQSPIVHEIKQRSPGLVRGSLFRQSFPAGHIYNQNISNGNISTINNNGIISPSISNPAETFSSNCDLNNTSPINTEKKMSKPQKSQCSSALSTLPDLLPPKKKYNSRLLHPTTRNEDGEEISTKREDKLKKFLSQNNEDEKDIKTLEVQEMAPHLQLLQGPERVVYKPVILVTPADPDAPCSADEPNETV